MNAGTTWACLGSRDDIHNFPGFTISMKLDDAVTEGKERVVTPTTDIHAGCKTCAPLADDDASGGDNFAAESFHSKSL